MNQTSMHALLKHNLQGHLRGMTPEQQADFMACLMTAVIEVLPEFLSAMLKCMAGQADPPATGYDPGNRPRCE